MIEGARHVHVERVTPNTREPGTRTLPIETPVAIDFNGIGYAVMMSTPTDLKDFASGFALSEQIVENASGIREIDVNETPQGWVLSIWVDPAATDKVIARARTRVAESGCGLCGIENLERIAAPLPKLPKFPPISDAALFRALDGLRVNQPLHNATGGVHAAAFCTRDGDIVLAREDVGRHNALDKVIGALARGGIDPAQGFILMSSRCSYELVEKTVLARCPVLVTISTATTLAVDRAAQAGLTLFALARPDAILQMTI
jgi:FdhD protein